MNKEILDFSLCKRLYEAGVRVDNDFCFYEGNPIHWELYIRDIGGIGGFKNELPALTIVEGLEYLSRYTTYGLIIGDGDGFSIDLREFKELIEGKTLKECVEKSLTFLLDNGYLSCNLTKN